MVPTVERGVSPVREFWEIIESGDHYDRLFSEEEAKQLIPDLLLTTMELGGEGLNIAVPNLSSAIEIVPVYEIGGRRDKWGENHGALKLNNARVQVEHPQFKGTITISGVFFNLRGHEDVFTQRNLSVQAEGKGLVAMARSQAKIKLSELHKNLRKGLKDKASEYSQGTRKLKRFRISIYSGENPGVRVLLEVL